MKRGTPTHPKTVELANVLALERWGAVGILESLWHFAASYARRGDIGRHSDAAIAAGIDWSADPQLLIAALIHCRWVDCCKCHRLRIHDWPEHVVQSITRYGDYKDSGPLECYSDPSSLDPSSLVSASEKLVITSEKLAAASESLVTASEKLVTASLPLPLPLPLPLRTTDSSLRSESGGAPLFTSEKLVIASGPTTDNPGKVETAKSPQTRQDAPGSILPPGTMNQSTRRRKIDPGAISKATEPSWRASLCEDWIGVFGGTAPGAQITKALRPLVDRHGLEEVRAAWRNYLIQSEPEFANAARFANTYARWVTAEGGSAQGPAATRVRNLIAGGLKPEERKS